MLPSKCQHATSRSLTTCSNAIRHQDNPESYRPASSGNIVPQCIKLSMQMSVPLFTAATGRGQLSRSQTIAKDACHTHRSDRRKTVLRHTRPNLINFIPLNAGCLQTGQTRDQGDVLWR